MSQVWHGSSYVARFVRCGKGFRLSVLAFIKVASNCYDDIMCGDVVYIGSCSETKISETHSNLLLLIREGVRLVSASRPWHRDTSSNALSGRLKASCDLHHFFH